MKQLSEDPWESIARAYPRGSIITGEITNITDFGFFVKVQGGIEGLVHKLNIVDDRVEPLEAAMAKYKVGDTGAGGGHGVQPLQAEALPVPEGLREDVSSARRWTSTSTTSPSRTRFPSATC